MEYNENIFILLNLFNNKTLSSNECFKKSKTIGWNDLLETITLLQEREFIKETDDRDKFFITEIGKRKYLELKSYKEQLKKDQRAEKFKLHNESIMSGWKRKTFWFVFIFGLLGGFYSTYDFFIKNPTSEKRFQKIEQDILKNRDTIKELSTLILNQKNLDSLNNPNSELNK